MAERGQYTHVGHGRDRLGELENVLNVLQGNETSGQKVSQATLFIRDEIAFQNNAEARAQAILDRTMAYGTTTQAPAVS